ncbi:YbaB/EbfC family nucleoid-associated protein [Dactylosporangium aurantiacum]|uniref:YbaB/EbfC family nucleoid-associated protein n=1 Tax=Dactylosporangium aurantiacum TaxID=35754 RepID=A0A9Q9IG35_9ACTN|nr:YbaB/EbfC family nucleoid-associated protein [Dactylosporangium aurantiacum]MDG6101402.1 YbaB/EbfC family nucleoid-associated protein [Dactylosporangium aurantiacum]UWZ52744.1 YbaB/EbfC family nucleoid-associated protein [Dactylosporangium aurantiacum]
MADEYAQRIDDAKRQLAEVRAVAGRRDATAPAVGTGREATGHAGDGAVEVVADGGRLRSVTLAPQVMRRTGEEVGALLTEAANQALRRSRVPVPTGAEAGVPSLAALEASVEQVRDQGERAMYEIQTALDRTIAKVGDRTGLGGDTGGQGLDQLLAALAGTLRAARATGAAGTGAAGTSDAGTGAAGPGDTGSGDADARTARGADDEGHVSALVDAGGTVTGLTFGPWAMRLPSVELAAHTVTAVNAALAGAEADGAARAAADLADLRRRVEDVRQASVTQMTQLTAALTGIMSRIREP